MKTDDQFDLHQHVTDQIVQAIEAGAPDWEMPWRRAGGALHRPSNVLTGNRYQGVNVLSLWLTAEQRQYTAPIWGTYRQWQQKNAQVRKGERGSPIVFYKDLDVERTDEATGEASQDKVMLARASWVFNVAQVDGYAVIDPAPLPEVSVEPVAAADDIIRASGAVVKEAGDRAYYSPGGDFIAMPDRARFIGSASSSATEAWYAVHLHELTHWTGPKHRLDRDLANRFGSEAYAMEELVAELGSAFLCADIGLTPAPRLDHAAYVANWLRVLKDDRKAIFTAASQADRAARYLFALIGDAPSPTRPQRAGKPEPSDPSPGPVR